MGLETGTYVNDLNTANPTSTDPKSQGDDHLRLIKSVLKNTFAGFPGLIVATGVEAQGATVNDYVVTVSPAPAAYTANFFLAFKATHTNTNAVTIAINALAAKTLKGVDGSAVETGDIESGGIVVAWYNGTDFFLVSGNDRAARAGDTYTGVHDFSNATQVALPANTNIGNVSAAEIAVLDGITASTAELNVLDGITASTAELNVLDGIIASTAELNSVVDRAYKDSPTFTGDPKAPTPALGDNDTSIATTKFVQREFAKLDSPVFTGTPQAPTAPVGTATTQLATTDFVNATALSSGPINHTPLLAIGTI